MRSLQHAQRGDLAMVGGEKLRERQQIVDQHGLDPALGPAQSAAGVASGGKALCLLGFDDRAESGQVLGDGQLQVEPARTLMVSASAATKVYGPASSGRLRKDSTCSSTSLAITLTWDLDSREMPRVSTSFSIRRVDTPSR